MRPWAWKMSDGNIRLCFAFRWQEPSCYGGNDNDHKANDDTPAKMEVEVSKPSGNLSEAVVRRSIYHLPIRHFEECLWNFVDSSEIRRCPSPWNVVQPSLTSMTKQRLGRISHMISTYCMYLGTQQQSQPFFRFLNKYNNYNQDLPFSNVRPASFLTAP